MSRCRATAGRHARCLLCVVLRTRSSHPAHLAGAADRTCGPRISAAGRTDRRHWGANKAPDGKIVREVSIDSVERPEIAVLGLRRGQNFWTLGPVSGCRRWETGGSPEWCEAYGGGGGGRWRSARSQVLLRVVWTMQGGIGSVCALCAPWGGWGWRYRSCMMRRGALWWGWEPIVRRGERPFG